MKRLTISIFALTILMSSCGSEEKKPAEEKETTEKAAPEEEVVIEETVVEEAPVVESTISGEDLFASTGCVACHQADTKTVGPALTDISAAYADNKEGLTTFLAGEGTPIVDPAQEAVMAPQVEITKALSDEERTALAEFILSH